ncbi:MAG: S41 family peptidase [Candidatus Kapabacteria bacterium]|nr:S41 family peptidase [Candidatus Kapabacteria bacterium]
MLRYIFYVFVVSTLFINSLIANEDVYYKINKSFNIQGAVFNELLNGYVVDLDPEILIRAGIEGMISSLDPYTEYFSEKQLQDVDFLSSGTYSGLGITVGVHDSMLIIVDVRHGYPAQKGGLKIGDYIYKADSNVVINKSSSELREFTKGDPGTELNLTVIRKSLNTNDTLQVNVVIENIKLPNVPYSGFLNDSTGIIILERFTKDSYKDFRSAFNKLHNSNKLKNLVIDLRDNPGGLLEEAVSICELFLPSNSLIVTTKSRENEVLYEYISRQIPLDTNVRLAVLINQSSASASEVVAGAIQDHDRGLVIGQQSFGKGLVQSVVSLPYGGNLKITTAKYYTPSGRCIQRIGFAEQYSDLKIQSIVDSTQFQTKNGRIVYESTGIKPDSVISPRVPQDLIYDMNMKQVFFDFANQYATSLRMNGTEFVPEKSYERFLKYLKDVKYDFKFRYEEELDEINSELEKQGLKSASSTKIIEQLKTELAKKDEKLIKNLREDLTEILEYEIYRRSMNEEDFYSFVMSRDRYVKSAVSLMSNNTYKTLLSREND